MDCSIVPLRHGNLSLISTTDFFYPLVDDPYMQGKIGCANVLSDLYAMGIYNCDNMLMILAASRDMNERERNICTKEMIRGFNDLAKEAETEITGGQTVMNPWPIIGGVATSVCTEEEFIRPELLEVGDVIVLTKPLGTQVAVNAHQWLALDNQYWKQIKDITTPEDVKNAYETAMYSMARLNRNGAKLMLKYGAHGATDVTGFGILGHANNLAENQSAPMNIEIHTLPIIKKMAEVEKQVKLFKLMEGFSAETSGGLLVCLPEANAQQFIDEIQELDNKAAWIVGRVVENTTGNKNSACIAEDVSIIEV
uniref:Selenide, water dikinase n=1 Tax=Vannella robusta TaxID=1487602 RepID=A0A7S4IDY6_9EUKA|mmetsp:Transcript_24422/g.31061  ORF Transcript_24422/g.31061 Transcript_24422/m.31061 type:complete len:310 (+) Transcript_24422:130-1059(+)